MTTASPAHRVLPTDRRDRRFPVSDMPASDAIEWAVEHHGDALSLLCSGQDAVLVDLAMRVDPDIEVVFIDTGFHFPETIATMADIVRRYRPKLRIIAPSRHLPKVDESGFCCSQHKVEQLEIGLTGRSAWMSGARRTDHPDRVQMPQIGYDRRGLVKINPIIAWDDNAIAEYVAANDVTTNPLHHRGYPSIGCRPCTTTVDSPNPGNSRDGRWAGQTKTECGLHL